MKYSFLIIFVCIVSLFSLQAQIPIADSTISVEDSIKKPVIPPNSRRVYPARIFAQDYNLPRSREDFHTFDKWDILDTLKGWVNGLGLVGKPYRHSRFGVNDRWFKGATYRNPLSDNPNIHLIAPEEARYYDTKTPYTRVDFAQGSLAAGKLLALLDFVTSYNFTPNLNVTGYYKRRQAQSIYGADANSADNRLIHLNGYYHTSNHRYEVFSNFQYNEFYNFFHGGVRRELGVTSDTSFFFKGIDALNLSGTLGRWVVRSAYADQYYHLWKARDSARLRQQLSFRNFVKYDNSTYLFTASGLNLAALSANWVPPLPTLKSEATDFLVDTDFRRAQIGAEAHYAAWVKKWLQLHVEGGVNYQNLRYRQLDSNYQVIQNRVEQRVKGRLTIPKIFDVAYETDFYTRQNNLFKPETYWENTAEIHLPFYKLRKNRDSLVKEEVSPYSGKTASRTLHLSLSQILHDQNPSIFQSYMKGGLGNNYRPNANLTNQQLNHVRARVAWEGLPAIRQKDNKKDTLLANYMAVQPFVSRISNMIYYNDSMRVLQVPRGVSLNFVGLEVEGRVRAYRKMYVEGMACLQRGAVSDSVDDYFQKYAAHLPNVYGRLSIFYQNDKVASYKGILKIGVDMRFGSTYLADAIDIVSGEYFPTKISYTMNYYPRIDVLFATHIKRAYVFFKWVNVADGLITRGNYTTPFYPVFPRMLTAGINWTFFD